MLHGDIDPNRERQVIERVVRDPVSEMLSVARCWLRLSECKRFQRREVVAEAIQNVQRLQAPVGQQRLGRLSEAVAIDGERVGVERLGEAQADGGTSQTIDAILSHRQKAQTLGFERASAAVRAAVTWGAHNLGRARVQQVLSELVLVQRQALQSTTVENHRRERLQVVRVEAAVEQIERLQRVVHEH